MWALALLLFLTSHLAHLGLSFLICEIKRLDQMTPKEPS